MTNPYPVPRSIRQTDILVGNGGKVYGPFDGLQIFDNEDVVVYTRTDDASPFEPVAVTVAKVSGLSFDFFTIEFSTAIDATTEFIVASERVPERSAAVKKGTMLDMTALEKELSKVATVDQELRRDVARAMKVGFGQEPQDLPVPVHGRVLGWSNGQLANQELVSFGAVALGDAGRDVAAAATFRDIRDFLELTRGFHANPAFDDTANFNALEAFVAGIDVDMKKGVFRVAARRTANNYRNGFQYVPAADDGADILYPARDTLVPLGASINVMPNERYVGWAQGGPAEYKDQVLVKANTGASHEDASQHVLLRRSGDGGASFKDYPVRLFQRNDGKREMCMAVGNVGGQWLLATFLQTIGSPVEELKIYGSRCEEFREFGAGKPNAQIRVTAAAGSNLITVYDPDHDVKSGDRVRLEQASATVGGLTLSGVFTVFQGGETNYQVTAGSNAAFDDDKNIDLNVTFIEDPFTEIKFASETQSVGSAIVAASTFGHTMPTQISGICGRKRSAGDIFLTIHGGGVSGPFVVRVDNILRTGAAKAVTSVERIGTLTQGLEASIDIDHDTGDMFGAIRTEGGYPYRRWYLPFGQPFANALVVDGPASPFGAASPIGVRKIPGKNAVFGIMSGNRLPSKVGLAPVVGLYLLYMTWDDFKNPAKSFNHIHLHDLHYTDYLILDRNGIGVPGIYVTGGGEVIGVLWSDQFRTGSKSEGGQSSTFLQRFYIGPEAHPSPSPPAALGGWFGATHVPACWPQEDVTELNAHFNTNGSLVKRSFRRGLRLACVTPNVATGVYLISFEQADGTPKDLLHTNYYPIAICYSGAHYAEIRSQTSTGFEVRTYDAAGAPINRQFILYVRIDNEWSDDRD
ncbi:hypothetical protein CN154_15055 [Sinorhizobium meliloti]|uniref:hypothetical protein n=1 Tax=Rhizobium meliloti TaxID=382 RepID=UPI000FD6FE42|nr:hypothetical protein [Sinorhizobium meliloti]RVK75419.1 hypothetical protein CN154_15055 [Sinorhizobium meliloti]